MLNCNINKCCDEAEEKHDISLFLKSNDRRKSVKEKNEIIKSLDLTIKKVEDGKHMYNERGAFFLNNLLFLIPYLFSAYFSQPGQFPHFN